MKLRERERECTRGAREIKRGNGREKKEEEETTSKENKNGRWGSKCKNGERVSD